MTRGERDKESLSESGHSTSEQRLLTPIHLKDASPEHLRVQTVLSRSDHKLDSVSLSPLHMGDEQRRDGPPVKMDKHPTSFSPVKEPLLQPRALPSPVKHPLTDTEHHSTVPSLKETRVNISSSSESSVSQVMSLSPRKADVDKAAITQNELPEDSMLEDFNELQDALKAAGLPQITEAPPHLSVGVARTTTEEPLGNKGSDGKKSPEFVVVAPKELVTSDIDLHSPVGHAPVDKGQEPDVSKGQTSSEVPKPPPTSYLPTIYTLSHYYRHWCEQEECVKGSTSCDYQRGTD